MSDDANVPPFEVDPVEVSPPVAAKTKSGAKQTTPKQKKRPSDFEITRTILQRTTERKLPCVLRNMGEDPSLLVMCSQDEEGFVYGTNTMSLALVKFTDPELESCVKGVLGKLYGFNTDRQVVINLRDQISNLSKTKGESLTAEIETDEWDNAWTYVTDVNGRKRTLFFCQAVDSLFHFRMVRDWTAAYQHLLTTDDPNYLYHEHTHTADQTHSLVSIPPSDNPDHPITKLFPSGFRFMCTKGTDVLMSKQFKDFPYPIVKEEFVAFVADGNTCQIAHRITGTGWSIVVIRPNALFFPTTSTPLPYLGKHLL